MLTDAQRTTIQHAIHACRIVEGILMRQESELRSACSRLESWQADLARLLQEDAAPADAVVPCVPRRDDVAL